MKVKTKVKRLWGVVRLSTSYQDSFEETIAVYPRQRVAWEHYKLASKRLKRMKKEWKALGVGDEWDTNNPYDPDLAEYLEYDMEVRYEIAELPYLDILSADDLETHFFVEQI